MALALRRSAWLLLLSSASAELPCDLPSKDVPWTFAGPSGGYVDMSDPLEIASMGAAQALVEVSGGHLLATANGGVWKTSDDVAADGIKPSWTPALDGQPVACTSISAMESLGDVVLAGCGGATSSEMGYDWMVFNGGDWAGVMLSRDGGDTWAMTSFPAGYFVTAFVLASDKDFFVSARARFDDRDDGGIWATADGGQTWTRVFERPVYDLATAGGFLLAAVPWTSDANSAVASGDGGKTWAPFAAGLDWQGRTAFYPTFAVSDSTLFLGALTVNPQKLSDTASRVFARPLADLAEGGGAWAAVANQPARLDVDGMPKDRMALLALDDDTLYVAGNAEALVWRVDWRKGVWTEAHVDDTEDRSAPHSDCRRLYKVGTKVVVLSDGGAFVRSSPAVAGKGSWTSLAGDIQAMEFVSGHWDPVGKRWIAGAQDNDVQIGPINATTRATGIVMGDGTCTAVDTAASPPRLFGATQNLGNYRDDDRPGRRRRLSDDDDDDAYGFKFWQEGAGQNDVGIPLMDWFHTTQFPFFSQPFSLNSVNSTRVVLYAGPSAERKYPERGFYAVDVPDGVRKPGDIAPPTLLAATDGDVYTLQAGGTSDGKKDASVLVGLNDTHLLVRSAKTKGRLVARRLPTTFAKPIVFEYVKGDDGDYEYILGPTSHDKTVSLAVSPADSSVVAVTGWTSIVDNSGDERVYASRDAGETWADVTGNLREATGALGAVRPSALLLLPLEDKTALLVGTANGVYGKVLGDEKWTRLGACGQLPHVLVAGLSHEPADDTLLAATMGRGIYVVQGATKALAAQLA